MASCVNEQEPRRTFEAEVVVENFFDGGDGSADGDDGGGVCWW